MVFLLSIGLVIASYGGQVLSVPASRAMITKVKNGEHSFSFAFRHFAKINDLGGMHRLLWEIQSKQEDRLAIQQLLLANDEPELANNSYRLLRKIIRNSGGQGRSSYIAKAIVAGKLEGATFLLKDRTINFYLALREIGKEGGSVDEKLLERLKKAIDDFDQAYQEFSFIYLNVTQGSERVGAMIRRYFNNQAKNITESILEQPLSKQTRPFIHNDRGGLIDSINNIHRLAVECRSYGNRDELFLDLTFRIERLATKVGVSRIFY